MSQSLQQIVQRMCQWESGLTISNEVPKAAATTAFSRLTAMRHEDFGVNLAKAWAALPVPKDVRRGSRLVKAGQSHYADDGLNRALVSVTAYLAILRSTRG